MQERVEVGRALNSEEEATLLEGASKATSPFLFPAIGIALNTTTACSHLDGRHLQPAKAITSFKTAWQNLKTKTGVKVRIHDLRRTAIARLSEYRAGDEKITQIAGRVSRRMLSSYSQIRTEAKREVRNRYPQDRSIA